MVTVKERQNDGDDDGNGNGNEDVPAILYPPDVADIMRHAQPGVYRRAQRSFVRQFGMDPRDAVNAAFRDCAHYLFCEWLTYDVKLEGADDLTPFDFVALSAYGRGLLSDRHFADMQEISESNFASWFWMNRVSAAERTVVIEDLADGTVYSIQAPDIAARYDGAPGGSMVARLAKVRDEWLFVSPPPAVIRDPHGEQERERVATLAQLHQSDFLGLLAQVLPYDPTYLQEVRRARSFNRAQRRARDRARGRSRANARTGQPT